LLFFLFSYKPGERLGFLKRLSLICSCPSPWETLHKFQRLPGQLQHVPAPTDRSSVTGSELRHAERTRCRHRAVEHQGAGHPSQLQSNQRCGLNQHQLLNRRITGWQRPLRSSSPSINPTPPRLLNHVLKFHV